MGWFPTTHTTAAELRHPQNRSWLPVVLIAAPTMLMLIRLGTVPPLFFDEGWVLSIARNWAEKGHYGQFSAGLMVSDGIPNVGLPVIAPVALSFRLLGVGAWQARVPAVLFTVGALIALYVLAKYLFGRSTGLWSLALAACATPLSTILTGRQVLGEIPALLFYFLGLLCIGRAQCRVWHVVLAALSWGTALAIKVQFAPFLAVSLLLPCACALSRGQRRIAAIQSLSFTGALVVCLIVRYAPEALFGARSPSVIALASAAGVMWVPWVRLVALKEFVRSGFPAAVGLVYGSWTLLRQVRAGGPLDERLALRAGVLVFAGNWLVWYLLLSPGWERYLFPAVFLGAIFLASLADASFRRAAPVPDGAAPLRRHAGTPIANALFAVMLFVWTAATVAACYQFFVEKTGDSIHSVETFINSQTPAGSLIETYDMELLFLLKRKCHFPPDRVQLALNERMRGSEKPLDYDPVAADPDYLVIGLHGRGWGLYDSVVQRGEFRLVREYEPYSVYERIRR